MRVMMSAAMAALTIAACTPAEVPERPNESRATQQPAVQSTDVHAFRIGALEAWSLKDSDMSLPVDGADTPWKDPAALTAALQAAGQPGDAVRLSIQPLLVRDGDRLVLIDTGVGQMMGMQGRLAASLQSAGVDPASVTDILISHAHGDHLGGLVGPDGTLRFPNAVIRMSEPEWAYAQAGAEAAGAGDLLAAIRPRVQAFAPGAQVTPSIRAVPLAGHTPGHTGYEIVSGADRLLYFGDAMHSSIVSVGRPDLANAWDLDGAAGAQTRADLLARAADGNLRLYGGHFPWPGVGRIERAGDRYRWLPES